VTLKEIGFVRILADLIHTKGDTFIELTFNSVFQLQDNSSKVKTEFLLTSHLLGTVCSTFIYSYQSETLVLSLPCNSKSRVGSWSVSEFHRIMQDK